MYLITMYYNNFTLVGHRKVLPPPDISTGSGRSFSAIRPSVKLKEYFQRLLFNLIIRFTVDIR